ncbi:hypothetical protein M407DRAFT_133352 [Tulasnella calospora MUT 4182]|uniref:Ubiquitin 3 binding protein But2 C-terminal domain-containing protein n=1 Tax=Tulasnella calospora MUT 4182 TaxID=1051891 RepID=A0A0C3QRM9_9AGAM|nr:hypothetical protein M407DRAFT_133352 [Tulasnella calospora MUT 4182]
MFYVNFIATMYAFSVLASLLAVVSASPAPMPDGTIGIPVPTIGPCTDSIKPHAHIIATPDTTLVAGLQLSYDSATSGRATLTDSGYYSLWDFSNGGVAVKPDCGPPVIWLNIDPVVTEYRPVYWNKTQITTNWSTGYGSDLVAKETKEYNTTSTFIACKRISVAKTAPWYLFLLTPTTVPLASAVSLQGFDTKSCVKTRLTVETPTYPTTP